MNYQDKLNEYLSIKTPEELLAFMDNNIIYGIYGIDDNIYDASDNKSFQEACQSKWILSDYKRLLKYGYGHCFDQVELERDWFKRNNYEFKTIFIWFLFDYDNTYPTHTYLVYKEKETNKWCWFEHADYNNRGIYKYDTLEELISDQKNKHIEYAKKIGNIMNEEVLRCIHIYEYNNPKYGCGFNEFIENILESEEL